MKRLIIFILSLAVVIILAINIYKSRQHAGEGCYTEERFVLPDVCIGACSEGEICKVLNTRGYIFGLLKQPSECACAERGKSAGSMGETGTGVTGVVIPPE
ncbi:MAG: hypothetical protein HY807_09830 [Nitrospirae bacterium]|nr:hypothetical protein [Nitrospirota bacterium]